MIAKLMGPALLGAAAGAVGTLAMDLLVYSRYRKGGGDASFGQWETAAGADSYESAPVSGKVGQLAVKALTHSDPPPSTARSMSNLVHWATGIKWGAAYGILAAGPLKDQRAVLAAAFGPVVWATSYATLAPLGLYQSKWDTDSSGVADDLSAHILYGSMTAAAHLAFTQLTQSTE